MLIEVKLLICVVGIACAGNLPPSPFKKNEQSSGLPISSRTVFEGHETVTAQPLYHTVSPPSIKYLPTKTSAYEVNYGIVDTVTPTPVATKTITDFSQKSAKQVAFYAAADSYNPHSPANKHFTTDVSGDIKPYYGAPVAAKTVSIGSHGTDILSARYADHVSALTYANNFVPIAISRYATAAPKTVTVESYGTVNVHPAAYANQRVDPETYVSTVAPPVANNVGQSPEVIAHHPYAVFYPVNQVKTVVNQPQPQYYPTVKNVAVSTVPVATKTVTVESSNNVGHSQNVITHQPSTIHYPVNHVKTVISQPQPEYYPAVKNVAISTIPVATKTVTVESSNNVGQSQNVITHQPSTVYYPVNHGKTVISQPQPQTQYYPAVKNVAVSTIPVATKTVTVESSNNVGQSQNVITHQPSTVYYPVNHGKTVISQPQPQAQYYPVVKNVAVSTIPVATKTVTVESSNNVGQSQNVITHQPSTVYYPVNHGKTVISQPQPQAQYYPAVKNVAVSTIPVATKTVTVESSNNVGQSQNIITHQPSTVYYPVNHVKTLISQPQPQYYPVVKNVAVHTVPVTPKTVTVESFNSVTAHPPPAPKYAPVTAQPIPVPVLYQVPAVETHHPSTQQVVVSKSDSHPIPVIDVRFNPVAVPLVHSKNFVERVYTPVGPTPTPPPGYGYEGARVVAYSPAAAVSRVTFNGLGVSYGY